MRTITLPLQGHVLSVDSEGRVTGDPDSPVGWTSIDTICRARGLPVGKLRYRTRLVSMDLGKGTATVDVWSDENGAAVDAMCDLLTVDPAVTVKSMRDALKSQLPAGDARRAEYDLQR